MNSLKVVVDTNIWIKGILFKENNPYCRKIMDLIKSDKLILLFAQDTFGELMYVLKENCIWNRKSIDDSLKILQNVSKYFYYGVSVNTKDTQCQGCNDEFDNMFIKCAVESNADYVISQDFASGMQNINDIKAIDAKKFIDIYYKLIELEKDEVAQGKDN